MSRLCTVLRVVIVCVVLVFAYRAFAPQKKTVSKPKRNQNFLAAPKRIIQKMKASSAAIIKYNHTLGAATKRFTDSASKNKPEWESIVSIGDAYARGKYPFLRPNATMAIACYKAAERCPVARVRATARSRMFEMVGNPLDQGDQRGEEISPKYGNTVCNTVAAYVSAHKPPMVDVSLKIRARPPPITNSVIADIRPRRAQPEPPQEPPTRRTRPARRDIGGGAQNTHDHGVVAATKTNIKQLKHEHGDGNFRDHSIVVDEMMAICKEVVDDETSSGVSENTLQDVYEVATSLTRDKYSDTGLTQIQILDLALHKIKSLDQPTAQGVKETLCKRLGTAIEDGKTVCATGKVARIVSVFEGVFDETQKAVSKAYVEREIAQLAAKVRDDFLDKVGPIGKKAYESTQSVPEYGASMANILKDQVKEQYVDKLGMSPTIIEPLVQVYATAF